MIASLDLTVSRHLLEPTPWELAQWRSSRGKSRDEWADILDRANDYRWDEGTLRCLDSEARRQEYTRKQWAMPAPAACAGGPRPNVFRCLFVDGGTSATRDSWFDASLVVLSGATVSDIVDRIDATHVLSQASAGLQPAAPAPDAAMSNALAIPFVRTAGNRFSSSRAAADWSFLHNGAGGIVIVVATPQQNVGTGVWLTTRTTATGLTLFRTTTGAQGYYVGNGGTIVINQLAGTGLAINVPTYSDASFATADTPDWTIRRKGTTVTSGNQLSTPAATAPQQTLMLGSDGTNHESMSFRALYCFRALSGAGRTICQQWIQADTGITP